jgi:multidrug efflux pump subunit AcrA (membrane-fusion protein)
MTAGHLDVVVRANQTLTGLAKRRWAKLRSASLTKMALVALSCLIALMCIPFPYRIPCECEVQPVMRRFVAAPHDGILEKTFVESGDIVEPNQLVAILDGRQLRIELSGLRAEYDGARKRRDSALAKGEIATSQIARSEMKRHQSKIRILDQQLANLEVRTPIGGIVVSGDLEKVEGAPLEMGQTLFEIAPLNEMLAEIGIPESEIKYAQPGMEVAIKLNAFPFETWTGTIEQIQPRTEIIDDESVFVAQVKLPNQENQLRPGMQGSAKVETKYAPLGWNLFHRPWESVRYWLIW